MKKTNSETIKRTVILSVISYIVVITLILLIVRNFWMAPMKVDGKSMNPTLLNRDILLIDKSCYKDKQPQRYDMIAFQYRYDHSVRYIKRVIGLPGETVEIKDNKIYINGEELKEYYGIYEDEKRHFDDYAERRLKSDEYFVLGDNRDHTADSRSGDVGPVEKDLIIGRAVFRILPLSGFGSLKNQ